MVAVERSYEYIASERLRLEAYRRLSEASTDADVDAVAEELDDRYGRASAPGAQPAGGRPVSRPRSAAGLREVTLQGRYVRFGPLSLHDWQRVRLVIGVLRGEGSRSRVVRQ
jgi:transcription-repair coupling factor (superfamily II helicase)